MKRINYLVAPGERIFGDALHSAASPRLRLALVIVGGALASLGLPYGVESARLHDLETAAAANQTQLARSAAGVTQVRSLERDVTRLRALDGVIGTLRRAGRLGADEIAELGDALPSDAWLTALRKNGEGFELDGGSTRLATVAATIAALSRLPRYADARLVSAFETEARRQVSYSIVLERRR